MIKNRKHQESHSVYPGEYVPFRNEEEVMKELKGQKKEEVVHPPVNITELQNFYKVEVIIPGVKKEEILIRAEGNALFLCVAHKEKKSLMTDQTQLQEYNCECFDRNIILPDDADAVFTVGEYDSGVLSMYVPKTNDFSTMQHARIVVY